MTWNTLLPVLILCSSLVPGLLIFTLREDQQRLRVALNLGGALVKLGLVILMLVGVSHGEQFAFSMAFLPGAPLVLQGDSLSLLFISLSSVLWLATTIYAIGYLRYDRLRSRFFGFFSLCVTATVGLSLAGNLTTFLLFYEFLTLTTLPLVVHRGNPGSLRAGRIYLTYTLGGGGLLLLGIVMLHAQQGTELFQQGGYLSLAADNHFSLQVAFVLLMLGLGVKAALFPLHGWLPQAMVAPAPVSALLHAVAVVKAGAFGIVRVVYEVYGVDNLTALNLAQPLLWVAALTMVFGSLRALQQQELKRRLAYSTISQVSYIVLGVALLGPLAAVGGLAHLVHQGLMKVTLFYCAGSFDETLGVHRVRDMAGIGRRMPLTMLAFSVGALGMIGVPPLAGFISKWYLGLGALEAEAYWVLGVLLLSAMLNAAYFLPLLWRGWFAEPSSWPEDRWAGQRQESHWMLLWPPLVTALLSILAGILAGAPYSPLSWAEFIIQSEFMP